MSLFDQLVDEALKNQPHLAPLRMVVEKELLHHDILRVLMITLSLTPPAREPLIKVFSVVDWHSVAVIT